MDKTLADTDGDTMSDREEIYQGWTVEVVSLQGRRSYRVYPSPGRVFSDGDLLTDLQEADGGLDPNNWDSDGDPLSDYDELTGYAVSLLNGGRIGSAKTNPLHWDSDGDGLSDGDEKRIGLNPNLADADTVRDSDGLTDRQEDEGWPVSYTPLTGRAIHYPKFSSNKAAVDTDGDGLDDKEERRLKTHPRLLDTDKDDRLTDFEEVRGCSDREPRDGVCDAKGRASITPRPRTDPLRVDTDKDGLTDGREQIERPIRVAGRSAVVVTSNPTLPDTDRDGLNDFDEFKYQTNPKVSDTDGDGANDVDEVARLNDLHVKDTWLTIPDQVVTVSVNSFTVGADDCDGFGKGKGEWSMYVQVKSEDIWFTLVNVPESEFSAHETYDFDPGTPMVSDDNTVSHNPLELYRALAEPLELYWQVAEHDKSKDPNSTFSETWTQNKADKPTKPGKGLSRTSTKPCPATISYDIDVAR